MKRLALPLLTLFCFTLLSACTTQTGYQIEPVRTETEAFDLEDAYAMIEPLERPMAEISLRESISRAEYDTYVKSTREVYSGSGFNESPPYEVFFDGADIDDPSVDPLYLVPDQFYPTIFHEGIELTDAQLEHVYYPEEHADLNDTILRITLGYQGEDERLEGWSRSWVFRQVKSGAWLVWSCEGTMNFLGDGYSPTMLPMKDNRQDA